MIDELDVRKRYNNLKQIWDPSDNWHSYTHKKIRIILKKLEKKYIAEGATVLFAGSAGNSYSLKAGFEIHLDIAENTLKGIQNSIVGSIQSMPLQSNSVDCIVCVGSVVNYVDLTTAMLEFQRVLKPKGTLILEFEKSDSLEYLWTKHFKKNISLVETFYSNSVERIWVYSYAHFMSQLKQAGFALLEEAHFHIASSLMLRMSSKSDLSSKLSSFDIVLSKIPILKKHSCNVLVILSKNILQED